MSVTATSVSKSFAGSGTGPYTMSPEVVFTATTEIQGTLDGVALTNGVDFTVDVGTQAVTTVASYTAGQTLVFYRVTAQTQDTTLSATETPSGTTVESALDKTVRQIQEAHGKGDRAIAVPYGETSTNLPTASDRASKWLGFDSTGDVKTETDAQIAARVQDELDISSGAIAGKGFQTFADAAARAAASPESTGQPGIQLDDFSRWTGTGTGAGDWQASDFMVAANASARDAAAPSYIGQRLLQTDAGTIWIATGTTAGDWNFQPKAAPYPFGLSGRGQIAATTGRTPAAAVLAHLYMPNDWEVYVDYPENIAAAGGDVDDVLYEAQFMFAQGASRYTDYAAADYDPAWIRGTIHLAPGTYPLTQELRLSASINLKGATEQGRLATVLQASGTWTTTDYVVDVFRSDGLNSTGNFDAHFSNLMIDPLTKCNGLRFGGAQSSKLENVWIDRVYQGGTMLYLWEGCVGLTVENCTFGAGPGTDGSNPLYGIFCDSRQNGTVISNCFVGGVDIGLSVQGQSQVTILGGMFEQCLTPLEVDGQKGNLFVRGLHCQKIVGDGSNYAYLRQNAVPINSVDVEVTVRDTQQSVGYEINGVFTAQLDLTGAGTSTYDCLRYSYIRGIGVLQDVVNGKANALDQDITWVAGTDALALNTIHVDPTTINSDRTITITGTPSEGDYIEVYFLTDGSARTFTVPAMAQLGGTSGTTTSLVFAASKNHYMKMRYIDSGWQCETSAN